MKKQRNYDKKVKHTRILLSDYLLLKGYAQQAGVSMSEALHKLIVKQAEPKPKPEPEPVPVAVARKPTFIARVKAPVALRTRPEPILTTNGHKAGLFVTKPKGGVIQ
ncbi:unnamed protein product [marine sediment metagenome]|uniref:Uncharacterized protein n=1 Tax=marine sediment metagenome TaxID=412755 RepID=X1LAI7_9ZZZZ